jgi:prepilin peptidase CpaA
MLGQPYFLAFAALVAALAAVFDWRRWEMPNALTLGALLVAPVAHAAVSWLSLRTLDAVAQGAGFSVLGAIVSLMIPFGLYQVSRDAIGGGDVKLFAALGAILRPLLGLEAEFYACLAACVLAFGLLAYHGKLLRVLGNTFMLALNPFLPKAKRREITPEMLTRMRFGPAIFAGTAVVALLHWREP